MAGFIHLHVQTHYSLLDGLIKVPELVGRTAELGMDSVAVTDTSNLFGAIEFQTQAKKSGVKPIFGCELSVLHGTDRRACQLVVLAENLDGYKNLVALISQGHLRTEGGEPMALTVADLRQYHEGLIALSGNLGGAIPQAFLRGQRDEAERLAALYLEIFGEGNFYLEIQRHESLPEQDTANAGLLELSKRHGLPLVATADVHYLLPEHANAQAVLVCIGIDKRVDLSDLEALPVRDLYVKSPDEMVALFSDLPEAISNTQLIADRCNLTIPVGQVFLPHYEVPDGHTTDSYFEELSRQGLAERFDEIRAAGGDPDEQVYRDRLEREIGIIEHMEYPGYFLIVWDFIKYARVNKIPVGPGRGSGAGSLVAYSLRITNIDPIPYGLLFERFLNPERVSMPDFDIDFCMNRRAEVIDYVSERYGAHNVGQIVTFGQLKAKACIRDIGRVLNLSYGDADRLAKLIPTTLGIKLKDAYKEEVRLREALDSETKLEQLFQLALMVEGTNRNTGIHAAGIVISDSPLWDFVPIIRGANGELVTQFAKDEVESAGLVKFDFLGLRNLTVIDDAVRLYNSQRPADVPELEIDTIPLDDKAVFKLLCSGETTGVFQMESSGFQELIKKLRPSCFEDIIAAGALYRPGPLSSGMVDDFIDCKHGVKEAVYPHPWVKGILRETHGVIVYQEQVMQIAQVLAGYTLGGADLLRRAMGKKKAAVMDQQRSIFLEGAKALEVDPGVAGGIFDKMALFAGYGFNKSHSAAYAMVTYQTAYLKSHHPVYFMAALMTNDADRTERVVRLINEARGMNIPVLPPDVNESQLSFAVDNGRIRFGLGAIKGVGHGAIEGIQRARETGRFTSLYDFCERVDLQRVNKRVVETLVKCGAFDSLADRDLPAGDLFALGAWRAACFGAVVRAFELGQQAQADRESGQGSLLLFGDGPVQVRYSERDAWSDKVLLEAEKECLGFYVSGHPLDRYENELDLYVTHTTQTLERAAEKTETKLGGVVASLRERRGKRGGRHCFVQFEDRHGQIEVLIFSRVYEECEEIVKSGEPLLVHGSVRIEGDDELALRKIVVNKVQRLQHARLAAIQRVIIHVKEDLTRKSAAQLKGVIANYPGGCVTELALQVSLAGQAKFRLPKEFGVEPSDELLMDVERLLGRGCVSLA